MFSAQTKIKMTALGSYPQRGCAKYPTRHNGRILPFYGSIQALEFQENSDNSTAMKGDYYGHKSYQTALRNWRSVAKLGKGPDGKPRRKSFTAPTRKEAERLAATAEHDFEKHKENTNIYMTLGEAWDRFLDLCTPIVSPATITNCVTKKNGILKPYMSYRLSVLDQVTIQSMISDLSREYKPTTIRSAYGKLCSVIKTFDPAFQVQVVLPKDDRE